MSEESKPQEDDEFKVTPLSDGGPCAVCKENTTVYCEVGLGVIFVCHDCLEKARTHFIFICMKCGKAHLKAKDRMIARMSDDKTMREAYMKCRDLQIIQGIDKCVECSPDEILMYHRSGIGMMHMGSDGSGMIN